LGSLRQFVGILQLVHFCRVDRNRRRTAREQETEWKKAYHWNLPRRAALAAQQLAP
jgi:hypothetical protein